VLVAGPDAQHAEDVLDAVSAGKRGVLCEKPFAPTVEEAVSMRDAAIAAEVPVVLGAMLEHDPAWSAGWAAFRQAAPSVTFVRSTMVLPHNDVLIGLAAQMVDSTLAPEAQPHSPSPSDFVRAGVLGLASHVVPQMRRFFRRPPRVVAARHVRPWGYHIVLEEEGLVGELLALMPTTYEPHWRFEADGPSGALRLEHPPSFLSAGSSSATVVAADGSSRSWRFPVNGYRGEWLHLHEAVTGAARARGDLDAVVDDVRFATGLIVGAAAVLDTR
jgi:predicted dehydrogenase